jgi:hypothetical protein
VSPLSGAAQLAGKAAPKTLFLDVVAELGKHGFTPETIPAKLEGLTFGPDVVQNGVTRHTLFISNDNDYLGTFVDDGHPNGGDNPNRWFVFAVDDADVAGYDAQPVETSKSCGEDHHQWDEWFHGHD